MFSQLSARVPSRKQISLGLILLMNTLMILVTNIFLLESTGSVGKSADSSFLSASVDDPDDAFVGFTYVPPTDLTE